MESLPVAVAARIGAARKSFVMSLDALERKVTILQLLLARVSHLLPPLAPPAPLLPPPRLEPLGASPITIFSQPMPCVRPRLIRPLSAGPRARSYSLQSCGHPRLPGGYRLPALARLTRCERKEYPRCRRVCKPRPQGRHRSGSRAALPRGSPPNRSRRA